MSKSVLIVGGGIAGLIAAMHERKQDQESHITLVNHKDIGGHIQSKFIDNFYYDKGMHTYYDTGIEWIDGLVREALDRAGGGYVELPYPYHDESGSFWKGSANFEGPFLDIRGLQEESEIVSHILQASRNRKRFDKNLTCIA